MRFAKRRLSDKPRRAHTEQPDALVKCNPLQTLAGSTTNVSGNSDRLDQPVITRNHLKIRVTQLDADVPAGVALTFQIRGKTLAERGKAAGQLRAIVPGVQVTLKRRFTAERFGFGIRNDLAFVEPMRGAM